MSYDSANGRDRTQGDVAGLTPSGAPGKRSETDRLFAPVAGTTTPASNAKVQPATTLAGTGWLNGVLGFGGAAHDPTGACNCSACLGTAGRMARGDSEESEGGAVDESEGEAELESSDGDSSVGSEPSGDGDQSESGEGGNDAETVRASGDSEESDSDAGGRPTGDGKDKKPKTPTPTMTSATVKAAPGGAAATRTKVAVGEVVNFTGSAAGTWLATKGTAAGGSNTKFAWTAPAEPGTATIKLTVGTKSVTKKFTIIAPNKLSMVVASHHALTAGVAGVCMVTNVTVGPSTVSFGNVEWLEVPRDATGVSGYFKKFSTATLHHNPNTTWLKWNDANTGLTDHAAWHSVPGPYKPGSFTWVVPNKYRVAAVGGAGKEFFTTYQVFKMKDKKGTFSVSKGGASASRTP